MLEGVPTIGGGQATRTWVSGVGDDANPCSRTAPCKTFAGAISKTAAKGEIDALDPGGFGAITITKAITIDGNGTFASILAALTTGVIINAGVNDIITLRNLSINGAGSGIHGIRFIQGATLHVENCIISNFLQKGIQFEPATNSRLFVKDCIIRSNLDPTNGGAINIQPGAAGSANVTLDNTRLDHNLFGITAFDRSTVAIKNSLITSNLNVGVAARSNAGATVVINVEGTTIALQNGIASSTGVFASGAQGIVRLSNCIVTSNLIGLAASGGGNLVSWGNNRIKGNTTDGAPTITLTQN